MVLVPLVKVAHTIGEEVDIIIVCSHVLTRIDVGIHDDIKTQFVAQLIELGVFG